MFSTGNPTVDAIGTFNFEGNIIPVNWFSTFKLANGKPDVNAIIILSEIVYWHRPSVVRNEETGQVIGIKKKFKADLLQRSYASFSDQFGLTKIQVRDALDRLESFGVIKKHFRTITVNNTKLNNVLFIDLITPVLFKVTTLSSYNWGGYQVKNAEAPQLEVDTNTEITTETTTDINTNNLDEVLSLWKPDLHTLNSWLQRAGEKPMTQEQAELVLLDVNAHYENQIKNGSATSNKMYSNFVKWVKGDFSKNRKAKTAPTQNNRNVNQNWGQVQHYAPATDDIDLGDLK